MNTATPAPSVLAAIAARRAQVAAALLQVLPARAVLSEPEDTRPYECDGLAAYRQLPMIVVLPDSEAQIVAVLRVCRELKVPIVPRGAGTGLSGGAMPIADGVVVSTARLNRIVRMEPRARIAVVQPGVRNLAISEAAAPHGLFYAPTRRRNSPAASAAMWPRTPAGCIA